MILLLIFLFLIVVGILSAVHDGIEKKPEDVIETRNENGMANTYKNGVLQYSMTIKERMKILKSLGKPFNPVNSPSNVAFRNLRRRYIGHSSALKNVTSMKGRIMKGGF